MKDKFTIFVKNEIMKANELRIGNWVDAIRYRDDSDKFYPTQIETLSKGWGSIDGKSVFSISMNHGFYETGSEWGQTIGNENEVKPIPLTEEWLIKFGLKKPAHSWIGSKFHLSQYDRDKELWICALNKNNAILSNIRYVHQLQNLYFTLTGEELTIEL